MRALAPFVLLALSAAPAGALTKWEADWELIAPQLVNDFHARVAFQDSEAYPRPRELDRGPFSDADWTRLDDPAGVTEISWTGGGLFGDFRPGDELHVGFNIQSLNAPRRKPPVILDAWWTRSGVFVETVPFTDLPFSLDGEEVPPVPLPMSGLLLLSGALCFWRGRGLIRRRAGLSCCAGGR
ncbi:MAG: hypothetical protein ACQEUZ_03025 [Pseudomonadota bacterium]